MLQVRNLSVRRECVYLFLQVKSMLFFCFSTRHRQIWRVLISFLSLIHPVWMYRIVCINCNESYNRMMDKNDYRNLPWKVILIIEGILYHTDFFFLLTKIWKYINKTMKTPRNHSFYCAIGYVGNTISNLKSSHCDMQPADETLQRKHLCFG